MGEVRRRAIWHIATHRMDPPDPCLHPSVAALRCVELTLPQVEAWAALRNHHCKGDAEELAGAFVNEAVRGFCVLNNMVVMRITLHLAFAGRY